MTTSTMRTTILIHSRDQEYKYAWHWRNVFRLIDAGGGEDREEKQEREDEMEKTVREGKEEGRGEKGSS